MATTLDVLNRDFAIKGKLHFKEISGGLLVAEVTTLHGKATIALQGAHLMTFQPTGQEPVIWLSELAKFGRGKSIRGGVPVCWPWFGPHATDSKLPGHGYARTVDWRLVQVQSLSDERIRLEFELEESEATRAQWPHRSPVRNIITVGRALEVELATTNAGSEPFTLGDALHTYFTVGDVRRVTVHGLEGYDYLDKVDQGTRKQQVGAVTIGQEVDRIYLNTPSVCEIRDPALQRRIKISSSGSHSTVVWNPWIEKATKMGDFGTDGHLGMLCVETANAAEDVVQLAPGQVHRLVARYEVEPL